MDGELLDDQVGGIRADRLVLMDLDEGGDPRSDYRAYDVGIGGGAASAEEAAVQSF